MDEGNPQKKIFIMPQPGSAEYDERKSRKIISKPKINTQEESEESIDALYNQANKLSELGHEEEALKLYRKIIEIDENHTPAILNMGTIYFKNEKFREAEKFYQQVLEIDPGDLLANFNMGMLRDRQNRAKEGIPYYLKAIEINPGYASAHYNLALAYQNSDNYKEAIRHYNRYLNLTTNNNSETELIWRGFAMEQLAECEKLRKFEDKSLI